jgi:hypothetical protein
LVLCQITLTFVGTFMVIESHSTILKEVTEEIIWSKKFNFVNIHHYFRITLILCWCLIYYSDGQFVKMETFCFNIICQLSSLF